LLLYFLHILQNFQTPRVLQLQQKVQVKARQAIKAPLDFTYTIVHSTHLFCTPQISHGLGLTHGTAAAAEAHTLELLTLYKHSLTLCQGLDPKEKAPGDDLIPLAAASLMAARNLDMAGRVDTKSGGEIGPEPQKLMQRRILQVSFMLPFLLSGFTVPAEM